MRILSGRRLLLLLALALGAAGLSGCGADKSPNQPPVEPPPADPGPPADTLQARIARYKLGPLPATPYPQNNRKITARIRLGRLLFWDPILGGESAPWVKRAAGKDPYRYRASDVACATCHQPQFGFADGRPLAAGVGGGQDEQSLLGPARIVPAQSLVTGRRVGVVPRNSMTLLNTALNGRSTIVSTAKSFQLMDGLVSEGLEFQAGVPPFNRDEMAGDAYGIPELGDALTGLDLADSLRFRIIAIPAYVEMFKEAFPGQVNVANDIRADMIFKAHAAFERELTTPGSRYDRFVAGDHDVFSLQEKQGFMLFFDKGKCGSCHAGPMLSDYSFRCQGTGDAYDRVLPGFEGKNGVGGDWGRFHGRQPGSPPELANGKYFFRVVSLRNVELTAPYFHSGSALTLRETVEFYNRGGLGPDDLSDLTLAEVGAVRDPTIVPLGLTAEEIDAIVAFMKTTTAPVKPGPDGEDLTLPPQRVPSGLLPPGISTPDGPGPFLPSAP